MDCGWPALSPGCVAAATFRVQGLRGSSTRVTCISAMQRLVSHCRVSCPCMQQYVDWPGSCGQFRPLSVRASHDDSGCEFPARWACQPTRADRFAFCSGQRGSEANHRHPGRSISQHSHLADDLALLHVDGMSATISGAQVRSARMLCARAWVPIIVPSAGQ